MPDPRPRDETATLLTQPPGPHHIESETHAAAPCSEGAIAPPRAPKSMPVESDLIDVPGYEVFGTLGRGGMGVVYHARQTSLGRVVALKMILAGPNADDEDLARFRTEAEAIARLQHPNIVQVFEIGEHRGLPFFSLEYCAGGPLDKKLNGTPLASNEAAKLVQTLARAMHAAHERGVIHRDLKPANVLLLEDGTPKITDFGLAKKIGEAGRTQEGAVMGTPSYMAPEQAGSNGVIGPPADVYALGAILYECLTGRPPFKGPTAVDTILQVLGDDPVRPTYLQSKTPRDLETICLKCLQKEPAKRYNSAAALADDLARYERGEPIAARPAGRMERGVKWVRRNPVVAGLIASLLLVFLSGFAGVLWKWDEAERQKGELATARDQTLEQRNAAITARDHLRRLLYASDLNVAHQAWEMGDLKLARTILDRQRPQDGQDDLRDFTWRYLWRLCQGDETGSFDLGLGPVFLGDNGYTSPIFQYSPDASVVAGCNFGGPVRIQHLTGSRKATHLFVPRASALVFTPGRQRLAVGSLDGSIHLWDLAENRLVDVLETGLPVRALEFSGDGKTMAVLAPDGIRLLDVSSGLPSTFIKAGNANLICFSLAPDGKTIAAGDTDRKVRLWNTQTGAPLGEPLPGHTAFVQAVAFSPDGARLASAGNDGTAIVWDLEARRELFRLTGHRAVVRAVAFSPDGKLLATASFDNTIKLWDTDTRQQVGTLRSSAGYAALLSFSPDGSSLATVAQDGSARSWHVERDTERRVFARHTGWVADVAFSPDGELLAASDTHAEAAKLWDVRTGKLWDSLPCPGYMWHANFAAEGRALATVSVQKVRFWDLKADPPGAARPRDLPISGYVNSRCFLTPDGRILGIQKSDATFELWDTSDVRRLRSIQGVDTGELSRDGKLLATGGNDGTIKLWEVSTGKEMAALAGHSGAVRAVAFTADGRLLASAGKDRTVRLWDVHEQRQRAILGEHSAVIQWPRLAFSPDGRTLAGSSDDGTVKLWHTDAGQELATLQAHQGPATGIAFSPDGNTLATAGADGLVRFWQAAPISEIETNQKQPETLQPEEVGPLTLETFEAGRAGMVLENGVYRVNIHSIDGPDWHVRLMQRVDHLKAGDTCTIRFRAKADREHQIRLAATIGEPNWHQICPDRQLRLTTEWQNYEWTIQVSKVARVNFVPMIHLGTRKGTVWVTDFSMERHGKN